MAFPTISDSDTKNGTVTTNSTSWTITWPSNLAAGDLILLLVGTDGVPFPDTLPAGFVVYTQVSGTAAELILAKKISNGTESGTFSLILTVAEQGAWRIFRIPAASWEGTLGTVFTNNASGGAVVVTSAQGATATPNPPNLDPNNWATEDTLWIASCAVDTSRTISVYPLAGRNTADVSGGSTGATLGVCTTTSAVSSLDPGTFTISASDDWAAITVAVRPSSNAKSGSGTLSTSASFASAGTKADSGTGSLTATATFARAGAKVTSGAGGALALSATLVGAGNAAEAHSGAGSLSLSASLARAGQKSGSGAGGSVTLSATLARAGTKAGAGAGGAIALTPTLARAGQKGYSASGSLTLSATLARAGRKGGQDSKALTLTLGFAATGTSAEAHSGAGALSLSATLASSATKATSAAGTLSLSASLARAGAKTAKNAGTLTLTPIFSSAGNEAAQSSGALTLAPTFNRAGAKAGKGAGSVALSLALSGSGSGPIAHSGSGTLELTLTFTAKGKAARPGGYVPYEPALPYIPRIAKRGSGRLRLYSGLVGHGLKTDATGHGELVALFDATSRARKAVAGAGEALEPYLVAWGVGYGDGDTVRALRAALATALARVRQLEAEVEALEALLAVAA